VDTADLSADPELIGHTAGRVLDAALGLGERTRQHVSGLAVSGSPVGELGARLTAELDSGLTDVQATLDGLAALLQGDADRLYATAFAAQDAQRNSVSLTSAVGDAS
jgi:hypothetical protein